MLLIGFVFEMAQFYFIYRGDSTNIFTNIFTLIETLFLFYFFQRVMISNRAVKTISLLAVLFICVWLFLFIKSGASENLDLAYGMECICIIGLSIYYFFEQVKNPDSLYIYSQARFWVVAAYLIYTAGTFFLFLYQKDLSMEEQKKYFVVNSVFLILKSFILSAAMFMKAKIEERKKFQIT